MKKVISLLILLLSFSSHSWSQEYTIKNKKAILAFETAMKSYQLYDYETALKFIDEALKREDKFLEAYFLQGEIFLETKKPKEAIDSYSKALFINPNHSPKLYFSIAEASLQLGDYSKAKETLEQYLSSKNVSPVGKDKANEYLKICEFALVQIQNPVPFKPINLGENINTKNAEYLPSITADEQALVITVRRPRDIYSTTMSSEEEDFYISRKIQDEWTKAIPLGPPVNTNGNEGAQAISPDGRFLIFTGCNRPDGVGSCDLYISERIDKTWTTPKNMGNIVNSRSWDSQPSIAADGKTVFFASSRAGGSKGQSDIWVTERKPDGTWTKPENLSDIINTRGIEFSPFIHPDNKTLYFASNGHPGMGGMDIFYTKKDSTGKWGMPKNIGYPINTFGDENSLILNASGDMAYFSSDRLGGFGKNDLFKFELYKEARPEPVTYMKGVVYDDENKKKLEAKFELIDLENEKTVVESYSDKSNGEFLVCLPTSDNYALNVSKEGYLFFSENFTVPEEARNKVEPYLKNIPLKPIKVGESIVLKNIFFDFDKYTFKKESMVELKKLQNFLEKNANMKVEIGGHTDNKGSTDYNKTLSHNRAKAVYEYLIENGIDKARLSYNGYGESKPIDTNETDAGRANNRRTEFKVTGK